MKDFSVSNPLLHYCQENYFDFCFKILSDLPDNLTLAYYDMRSEDFPDYFQITTDLFKKQIGILFHHKRSKPGGIHYETCTKTSHDESYDQLYVSPIYPEFEVPSLIDFLNREIHPEHDELRFKLLKWTINEESLEPYDLSRIPKEYLLDVLTLVFMTSHGFITVPEADLILFTIKRVELGLVPVELEPPEVVNDRAARISFLFTKIATMMQRSMEVTGFKNSLMVK